MFEATVSHLTNQHLFNEVAKQVTAQLHGVRTFPKNLYLSEIQQGVEFWPDGLAIPDIDVTWDKTVLVEMAKTSFRSCKAQWRVQVDDEAARMNAANLMTNRRRDRREGVLLSICDNRVGSWHSTESKAPRQGRGHRGGCGQVQREQEVGRRAVARTTHVG